MRNFKSSFSSALLLSILKRMKYILLLPFSLPVCPFHQNETILIVFLVQVFDDCSSSQAEPSTVLITIRIYHVMFEVKLKRKRNL